MLDTGDLLFMQNRCSKCFSIKEMRYCYKQRLKRISGQLIGMTFSEWDSVGVIIREKGGPRVLFYMKNVLYDLEYGETLSLPFFQDIGVRKLRADKPEIGNVGIEFRAKIVEENIGKRKFRFRPAEIVIRYWKATGMFNGEKTNDICIEHFDSARPKWLKLELAKYSEPIIVRTEYSRRDEINY